MTLWAHSENPDGYPQPLATHLENTAALAELFADRWGGGPFAHAAGLLHDIGKVSAQFQAYVRGARPRGGDHSTFGAQRAASLHDAIAFIVAGHHGGLADPADLKQRLDTYAAPEQMTEDLSRLQASLHGLPTRLRSSERVEHEPLEAELFIRMVFSALVDADFLDTEAHFAPDRAAQRGSPPAVATLWQRFSAHHDTLQQQTAPSPVNHLRAQVYRECIQAADAAPGMFSLTAPTGSGKTLSALAFALRHALQWGLDRIIVVIPYTSIIEQTADVYRQALGSDAVLEHHSALNWDAVDDTDRSRWQLACETWDASVVVTTAVQFFESLFANRPSACRKLHRIAHSVVIIDEVQTLPTEILEPSFAVLSSLAQHYDVTVLLSTATHPAYGTIVPAQSTALPIREIVQAPDALFRQLQRVHYELGIGGAGLPRLDWTKVAARMVDAPSAMAVVNSRADARSLFEQLPADSRIHLSTNLCGAHRRAVLATVRHRLAVGEPCHLATTQLVEAGVDLDFPLVLRALAPLDRIVQAAGRCNREGRHEWGQVVVFEPADGRMPTGPYRAGAQTAQAMLSQGNIDLHDPAVYTAYFQRLYHAVSLDQWQISRARGRLQFETVARDYRVIADDSTPVVIPCGDGEELITRIEAGAQLSRDGLRALQPYFVNLRQWEHQQAVHDGLCREIVPGLWRWEGRYDPDLGLVVQPGIRPVHIF